MYVMHYTRLDIAFAGCKLSRYTSNPSVKHWKAIARLLGYLKRTKNLGLFYNNFPAVLKGYTDASWITSASDISPPQVGYSRWKEVLSHGHLRNKRV